MKIIIVIPAFNEELILQDSVVKVVGFCRANLAAAWEIIIADNGSTDNTGSIGKSLAASYNEVKYLRVDRRGKGAAIKAGWQEFPGDVYIFMDADLATDLGALPAAITAINQGWGMAIGSRFHPDSQVSRHWSRRVFSRGYQLAIKLLLGAAIADAPCGFKAINQRVKDQILPQVQNNEWFFDSELVVLAEKSGFKIKEIPVIWRDPRTKDNKSKVKVLSLSRAYLKSLLALRRRVNRH